MQTLSNSGLLQYGAVIALCLLGVVVVLVIPVVTGHLKARQFSGLAVVFGFFVAFFWLWPTITEISLGSFGSIKTNVQQAQDYLKQMKGIQDQVAGIKASIETDTKSVMDQKAALEIQKAAIEKIRADIDKAQAARAPRHFTLDQKARLIASLRGILDKGPISVQPAFLDSTDARQFAAEISNILIQSGFTLVPPQVSLLGMSAPGVFMMANDIQQSMRYAWEVHNIFKQAADLDLIYYSDPNNIKDKKAVVIFVSSHPFD